MKSVKIVTYCTCSSIGSILQSFALKTALLSKGYDSQIFLERKKQRKFNILNPKQLCRDIFKVLLRKKIGLANQKRMDFISEYIDTIYYDDYQNLIDIASKDKTECYLAGSDQIWHPDRCNPAFFLDFAKNKKCISYAASMGSTIVPSLKRETFVQLLENFEAISVRESECKEVIKLLTGKTSDVHIDPTFLIEADEWRTYEEQYNVKEPYILLYMIYWDESLKEKVKNLKKRTGMKVYTIKNGLSRAYGDKILYDVGIKDFLWLVDHAEYIVTSSFHGVAMSVIFNKKFSPVVNPDSPSRIENLLRTLSIPCFDIDQLDSADIDYQGINQRILEERTRSLSYLQEVIG